MKITIVDKSSEKDVEAPPPSVGKLIVKKEEAESKKKEETDCPESYGGIGVTHNTTTCEVSQVGFGYPAYRAGIQPGDITSSSEINEDEGTYECPGRGEVGTLVTMRVFRPSTGKSWKVTMVREKICTLKENE